MQLQLQWTKKITSVNKVVCAKYLTILCVIGDNIDRINDQRYRVHGAWLHLAGEAENGCKSAS